MRTTWRPPHLLLRPHPTMQQPLHNTLRRDLLQRREGLPLRLVRGDAALRAGSRVSFPLSARRGPVSRAGLRRRLHTRLLRLNMHRRLKYRGRLDEGRISPPPLGARRELLEAMRAIDRLFHQMEGSRLNLPQGHAFPAPILDRSSQAGGPDAIGAPISHAGPFILGVRHAFFIPAHCSADLTKTMHLVKRSRPCILLERR
jgi:hypothetical protein